MIAKNLCVLASLGHVGQSLHEAYHLEPPSTLPWDLRKMQRQWERTHSRWTDSPVQHLKQAVVG